MASNRKQPKQTEVQRREVQRVFGSERDASILTGFSPRTFQEDRFFKRGKFKWYRLPGSRKILYDLTELEATIRSNANGMSA